MVPSRSLWAEPMSFWQMPTLSPLPDGVRFLTRSCPLLLFLHPQYALKRQPILLFVSIFLQRFSDIQSHIEEAMTSCPSRPHYFMADGRAFPSSPPAPEAHAEECLIPFFHEVVSAIISCP